MTSNRKDRKVNAKIAKCKNLLGHLRSLRILCVLCG